MTRAIMAVAQGMDEQALVRAAPACGIQIARRCVDAIDLRAAAELEPDLPVIVSFDFPRLDGDHVRALMRGGRTVVGMVEQDQHATELARLGIHRWVSAQGAAETTMRFVADALRGHAPSGVWQVEPVEISRGTVIGVTGPHGAPGRTTMAIALGRALTQSPTCVIDADFLAPAMTVRLGVIDDVSGLTLALRHLDHGSLRAATVSSAAQPTAEGFALLSGVRDRALRRLIDAHQRDAVVRCAAEAYRWVVVDAGPGAFVGDEQIVVVRPDVLSMMRAIEILEEAGQDSPDPIIAVNGRHRDLPSVRAALRQQGRHLPVVLARAKDVRDELRRRQGDGKTITRSPTLDHS